MSNDTECENAKLYKFQLDEEIKPTITESKPIRFLKKNYRELFILFHITTNTEQ